MERASDLLVGIGALSPSCTEEMILMTSEIPSKWGFCDYLNS